MLLLIFDLLILRVVSQRLLQVQIYARNGARLQDYGLWNPDNISEIQLHKFAPSGIRQMYELGQQLRREYIDGHHLINPNPNVEELYIASTQTERTLMSAHTILYSMFKNQQGHRIDDLLLKLAIPPMPDLPQSEFLDTLESLPGGYKTVPYHSKPMELDDVLLGWDPIACPIISLLNEENQNSDEMKKVNKDWEGYFEKLREKGLNVTHLVDAGMMGDDIKSSIYNGQRLPDLTEEEFIGLDYVRNLYYQVKQLNYQDFIQITDFNRYDQVLFQATPFIKNLLHNLNLFNTSKFQIYSGHDNIQFQILNLLNLTNWRCVLDKAKSTLSFMNQTNFKQQHFCDVTDYPVYGSTSIFELWTNSISSNDPEYFFIKFKFNGKYFPICQERLFQCPYYKFFSQLQSSIQPDYSKKCQYMNQYEEGQTSLVIIFTILVLILAFLFLVAGLNYRASVRYIEQDQEESPTKEVEMLEKQ